ncbi:MAG: Maf family protein [Ilumatobacteraceae bacterium]
MLASGSPRRRELLDLLGARFDVVVPDIDETPQPGEDPRAYVRRLAVAKADAVAFGRAGHGSAVGGTPAGATPEGAVGPGADALVIAADTTVDLGGRILGKPVDADDAVAMLRDLSGRTHRVHTGVALRRGEACAVDVATTFVTMTAIGESALRWYVGTGEPLDKAGAYAVQGAGGVFVERIRGSVSNVVGLPLHLVARLAANLGVPLVAP